MHSILIPSKTKYRNKNFHTLLSAPDSTYIKNKLTKYVVPVSSTFNLLRDETVIKKSVKPVTHIRSKFALLMCPVELNIPQNNIPIEIIHHMKLSTSGQFLPILQRDIMQMRLQDLVEVLPDMNDIEITFMYNPVSFGKLRFVLQIDSSLRQFLKLGFSEKDLDEVKNIFADTNLYLLCITVFIGGVHVSTSIEDISDVIGKRQAIL